MCARRLSIACFLVLSGSAGSEPLPFPAAGGPQEPRQEGLGAQAPAPRERRLALRRWVTELSELGARAEVERTRAVLEALGDPPDDLRRLSRRWEGNLARRSARGGGEVPDELIAGLRQEAVHLADGLEGASPERRELLAGLVLELDSEEPRANAARGRLLHEGRWSTPDDVERSRRRAAIAALVQAALRLAVEVETEAPSPFLAELDLRGSSGGEGGASGGAVARGGGVELHGWMEPETLARILRQALRGAALSRALLGGELAVPRSRLPRHTLLLCDSSSRYEAALLEAAENGGLTPADYERHRARELLSFVDRRGWRTSRWRPEAEFQALVLWQVLTDRLGDGAQACLVAGHVNWVTLELLGTSMPSVEWRELTGGVTADARSASERPKSLGTEELYRSARRTLFGCRSWMIRRVREGLDPPWSRAMVDEVGKITDETLLKTTLVVEHLQESDELGIVLELTRDEEARVPAFEEALGTDLGSFEADWREWLLSSADGERAAGGVVQTLRARSEPSSELLGGGELLLALNGIRGRAFVHQVGEVESVLLDQELSRGALQHSRYLARHPDQQSSWPDLHEEYADREGFSVEGARAGRHGLIAFTDDPAEALSQWMGTFYHRLPLLHPGLVGIGAGSVAGVTTMDVESLVLAPVAEHWIRWPADFASDVPLAFQPELPNPVPGEDMARLGYPVTLQVFTPRRDEDLAITLRLFEGSIEGSEVECHSISPEAPLFAELAPPAAWCLIPKRPLAPGTRYTVLAVCAEPRREEVWRFRTAEE